MNLDRGLKVERCGWFVVFSSFMVFLSPSLLSFRSTFGLLHHGMEIWEGCASFALYLWNDYIEWMTKVGSWIDEDMKIDDEPVKFMTVSLEDGVLRKYSVGPSPGTKPANTSQLPIHYYNKTNAVHRRQRHVPLVSEKMATCRPAKAVRSGSWPNPNSRRAPPELVALHTVSHIPLDQKNLRYLIYDRIVVALRLDGVVHPTSPDIRFWKDLWNGDCSFIRFGFSLLL
ncbi:hypothetical protein Tco_0374146 [Tanacetum coccineum]